MTVLKKAIEPSRQTQSAAAAATTNGGEADILGSQPMSAITQPLMPLSDTSSRTRSQSPKDTDYDGNRENGPDDHVNWSISSIDPWFHHSPHDQLSLARSASGKVVLTGRELLFRNVQAGRNSAVRPGSFKRAEI